MIFNAVLIGPRNQKTGSPIGLLISGGSLKLNGVKLLLDNLPEKLQCQRQTLAQCLEAMDRVLPLQAVYLFGSYARGEAQADSDVDLCIVANGAERQLDAARLWRRAMRPVWPRPAFTLVPISPARLAEKQASRDHFFQTVFKEGVLLATEN